MKTNKSLIILMVFISFLAIGAVSASDSDNITDIVELSAVDDEVQTVEDNLIQEDLLSEGEDNPDDVQITVNVEDTTYDNQVSVNVSVNDKAGTVNFTESTVEIIIDGKYIANAPISSQGVSGCQLALGDLEAGTYFVETTLVNGANKIATNSTVFNVGKATPIVSVENVTAFIGQGIKVPVNITDNNGNKLSGDAIVTIFIEGNSISKYAKIINGSAESSFDMADMMGGMMNMDWSGMFGGGNSSENSTQMEFNMSEMRNMMNGSGGIGGFGGMGSSAVKFNYYLPYGTYNLTVTFLPNRNYKEASTNTNFTVVNANDVLYLADISTPKSIGDKTNVTIMALDKYGNIIPNLSVTAIVDGTQEVTATLDEYGSAQVSFDDLVTGAHKLVVSSNATGNITNQTFKFDVTLPKIDVAITADDISVSTVNVNVDGKIGENMTVTLKDALGNPLVNKTVQLSIDCEKYNITTDDEGVAKLQLNIAKANVYTCAIAFLGDESYNGVFDIAKVTVTKQAAKLTVTKKTYKAKAKTKKLTATFKSAKGKALKGKKITFKVKGKTYTAKTNAKGVATVKVKLTKKGKYTFTAKFAGDSTYKAISKKAKLILK